jgi:hypothetical protein
VTVWEIDTTPERSPPHGWPCWAPDRHIYSHSFKATGRHPYWGRFISDYPQSQSQSPLPRQISCPGFRSHRVGFLLTRACVGGSMLYLSNPDQWKFRNHVEVWSYMWLDQYICGQMLIK